MRNYKYSCHYVSLDKISGQVFWIEHEARSYGKQIVRRSRDVCTDRHKKGYFTTANGIDFYCGPVTSEEYRCIDMSGCRTLAACKRALNQYYDAINASPDKYPGQMIGG